MTWEGLKGGTFKLEDTAGAIQMFVHFSSGRDLSGE